MSQSERALMEAEVADTVEGEFSYPVTLYGPNGLTGTTYATSKNTPTLPLVASIFHNARSFNQGPNGETTMIRQTQVLFRQSSVPASFVTNAVGDKWLIWMPVDMAGKTYAYFALEDTHAPLRDDSLGTIRVYPKRVA